jgi:4-diphosphocytidyl-2-C-methyl-D-erythritol kinase
MNSLSRKSYAKVNIFLKIAGRRGDYHELVSRFVCVKNLFDMITFIPGNFNGFTLEGDFGCEIEKNTIYKVYLEVLKFDKSVEEFFKKYKVVVEKNIPKFAGLGGGSSNAASFLLMLNEMVQLELSQKQMVDIGLKVGADIPFFLYGYDSANVTGIGEIVEKFEEETLDIVTFTPKVECDTGKIFRNFRNKFYQEITNEEKTKLLNMKSFDIMTKYDIQSANDLYLSAKDIYKELNPVNYSLPNKTFFSGSGSSFFYLNGK